MTLLLISRKVPVRHIPFSTGCRFHSAARPCRWSTTVLNHVSQAQPWHGSGSRTPFGLPAVTVIPVFHSYTQRRYDSSKSTSPSVDLFSRHEAAKRRRQEKVEDKKGGDEKASHVDKQKETSQDQEAKDDPRKESVEDKKGLKAFRPARLPIVLCHGFSGFDSLGKNPDFRFDYWYGVREALDEIGACVHTARVPPFSGIQNRAEALRSYIERTVPHGSELNLIGHSMGGLDCRYLISHLQSPHFKVRSLTTLGTPHRGSPFADYVMSDIVGRARLETFWKLLGLVGIERGAAENLTTYYLNNEFNPNTPNQPGVSYFSYAGSFEPGLFSRFRFPWQVIMDREGPNDGLVSVKSAQWGEYIRTIPNADHMDLMNWVNALAWSRARFPWILGGSSHDPEGRPKGAFETDNDDEGDRDSPKEESALFNAIELYLEISDMLHEHGL
ncbi:alpha/beta-hydrolase [Linnemannia elongata AG-77]|uniref:GPI inositol-deacylase n=1 Tax=Linnemannia elongata AG-77 TaxID=1314771 RepID=A0A197JBR6_9FUNG|nr:alpha/beta-hydrolase [Linnemannia elongata AG-77]